MNIHKFLYFILKSQTGKGSTVLLVCAEYMNIIYTEKINRISYCIDCSSDQQMFLTDDDFVGFVYLYSNK